MTPPAPRDHSEGTLAALDRLRTSAGKAAPEIEIRLAPELTVDALTDMVASTGVDLVAVDVHAKTMSADGRSAPSAAPTWTSPRVTWKASSCSWSETRRLRRVARKRRKINVSTVFAGQDVGVRQVSDRIWLVSFMDYVLGYFDDEECRLEPIDNPFSPKVLPMSPE